MPEYELHFRCCGHRVSLGGSRKPGGRDKHCLNCDTPYPETEVVER